MYTKDQVLEKLNSLLQYSITQEADYSTQYESIVDTANAAVNGYFDADKSVFKKPLDDLAMYLHNDLWQRGAKWSGEFNFNFSSNYPANYTDMRKLFYEFDWIIEITNEQFHNAWVMGSTEDTTPATPTSNTYISILKSDLLNAHQNELANIDSLASWLEESMGDYGSIMLWENVGSLVSAPETNDIAKVVFQDRYFLEAINLLNLPVYIPSYISKV